MLVVALAIVSWLAPHALACIGIVAAAYAIYRTSVVKEGLDAEPSYPPLTDKQQCMEIGIANKARIDDIQERLVKVEAEAEKVKEIGAGEERNSKTLSDLSRKIQQLSPVAAQSNPAPASK